MKVEVAYGQSHRFDRVPTTSAHGEIGTSPRRDRVTQMPGPDARSHFVGSPAFLHYYKKNPIQWERKKPALYWRHTMYVELRVEQDQQGNWLAYRDDYPMLENGFAPAWFKTCAEAKRAADVHELDLFPNAKVIDDGYSWLLNPELDWRSVPYLTEGRRDVSDLIVWRSDGQATTSSPN
jgi:hypothetical protein